jgi:hypothetical protein
VSALATDRSAVTNSHQSASSERYSRAKFLALGFSLITVLVVLSPIVQNWQPAPMDNFPLSYYPMFSYERSGIQRLSYLVGIDGRGNRVPIPYTLAGTGGMKQVRRQIEKYVNRNEADQLCRIVSAGVGRRGTGPLTQVASVQVMTGSFDLDRYYAGDKNPLSEQVRATCPVARRA